MYETFLVKSSSSEPFWPSRSLTSCGLYGNDLGRMGTGSHKVEDFHVFFSKKAKHPVPHQRPYYFAASGDFWGVRCLCIAVSSLFYNKE